jgi:hypothetical protein
MMNFVNILLVIDAWRVNRSTSMKKPKENRQPMHECPGKVDERQGQNLVKFLAFLAGKNIAVMLITRLDSPTISNPGYHTREEELYNFVLFCFTTMTASRRKI